MDLGIVLDVLLHRNTGWQQMAVDKDAQAFFTRSQSLGNLGLSMTYPVLLVTLVLLLVAAYELGKRKGGVSFTDKRDRNNAKMVIWMVSLSAIVYSFGLSWIYLFKFGEGGSMSLVSMDRYLRIPYLAMMVMGILLVIRWFIGYEGKRFAAFRHLPGDADRYPGRERLQPCEPKLGDG